MADSLKVDKELRDLLGTLDPNEYMQLRDNLKADGCRDSIKVWKGEGIIVDGHNRYEICTAENIAFKVEYLEFADRAEVLKWMYKFQQGRRNMTPKRLSVIRGTLYEARKKESPGNPTGKNKKTTEELGQNDPIPTSTAAEVAKETGVSEKTVKRDAAFTRSVNKLCDHARDVILNGVVKASKKQIDKLAEWNEDGQEVIIASVLAKEHKTLDAALQAKAKAARAPAPEPTTDQLGEKVPAKVADAFDNAHLFDEINAAFRQVRSILKHILETKAGAHVNATFVRSHLKHAQDHLKEAVPFAV